MSQASTVSSSSPSSSSTQSSTGGQQEAPAFTEGHEQPKTSEADALLPILPESSGGDGDFRGPSSCPLKEKEQEGVERLRTTELETDCERARRHTSITDTPTTTNEFTITKNGPLIVLDDYTPEEEEKNPIIPLNEEEPPPIIPRGELPKVMSATFAPEVETQLRVLDFVNHYLIQNGPVAAAVTTYQLLKLCGKLYFWMAYGQKEQPVEDPDSKLKSLADDSLQRGENDLVASGESDIDESELIEWFSIDPQSPIATRRRGTASRRSILPAPIATTYEELPLNEDMTQSVALFLEKEGMVYLKKTNIKDDEALVRRLCANDRAGTSQPDAPWGEKERVLSVISNIADEHLKPKNMYIYKIVRRWLDKYSDVFDRSIDDYVHPEVRPKRVDKLEDWENANIIPSPREGAPIHSQSGEPAASSTSPEVASFSMIDDDIPEPVPLWGEHHQLLWTAKQYKSILGIDRPELWRNLHLLGYLIGLSPQFLVLCATAEGVVMIVSLLEELAKHFAPTVISPRPTASSNATSSATSSTATSPASSTLISPTPSQPPSTSSSDFLLPSLSPIPSSSSSSSSSSSRLASSSPPFGSLSSIPDPPSSTSTSTPSLSSAIAASTSLASSSSSTSSHWWHPSQLSSWFTKS